MFIVHPSPVILVSCMSLSLFFAMKYIDMNLKINIAGIALMGKIIKWIWWLAVFYILCVHLYLQNAATEKYSFYPVLDR